MSLQICARKNPLKNYIPSGKSVMLLCVQTMSTAFTAVFIQNQGVGCPGRTQPVGPCRDAADFKGILRILCKNAH